MGYIALFPWITGLFGSTGQDYLNIFGLDYEKNVTKLIERIKKIEEESESLNDKTKTKLTIWTRLTNKIFFFKR